MARFPLIPTGSNGLKFKECLSVWKHYRSENIGFYFGKIGFKFLPYSKNFQSEYISYSSTSDTTYSISAVKPCKVTLYTGDINSSNVNVTTKNYTTGELIYSAPSSQNGSFSSIEVY